jgi:ATP-dependent Lhr-like helicase
LNDLHPITRDWFTSAFGTPTDVQALAWPAIAAGNHALITAPTGSGKTLTAFLHALDKLATGTWDDSTTSVLYVSPLRALNNDIRRNLIEPLQGLARAYQKAGHDFPNITVLTRSGDTPQNERRRMLKRPPQILITTPESLNLLLSSRGGRGLLTGMQLCIIDEIHAIAGTKRGTHLMTAVERCTDLSGEFQRLALSATVTPLDTIARFIGGRSRNGNHYEPRPVRIVEATTRKKHDLRVTFPNDADARIVEGSWWPAVIDHLNERIHRQHSTLIFSNLRDQAERVTRQLNNLQDDGSPPIAYAHHGSLSRELRQDVEQRLKRGELRSIVATSSLELGIDVGSIDHVVMIMTPKSVSSAMQRLGRAGHQVGATSSGEITPMHGQDFLDAAAVSSAVKQRLVEPVTPIEAPLDVLAQVLISISLIGEHDLDETYADILRSYPYRNLDRKHFDLVVDMLAGRYDNNRIRELHARISVDQLANSFTARRGASQVLYSNSGTIPNRGYYKLRLASNRAHLGELDEEFVWEAQEGDTFTLGTQSWRIHSITHNDVLVHPAGSSRASPFWKGERQDRDPHFGNLVTDFLALAEQHLANEDPQGLSQHLEGDLGFDLASREQLLGFLRRQRASTQTALPHTHHVVIEHHQPAGQDVTHTVIHTQWGGRTNRPLALALAAAWEEQHTSKLEAYPNDHAIALLTEQPVHVADLLALVPLRDVESLLRSKLESSGFFGARFREAAGRALLITRRAPGKRLPLWLTRVKAQELMSAVWDQPDFPILLEAWRECLNDAFDLPNLKRKLGALNDGTIRTTETRTQSLSPFATSLTYESTNTFMYADDNPDNQKSGTSGLDETLIRSVARNQDLRPTLDPAVIRDFEARAQRTKPGYEPEDERDLFDHAKDRVLIPQHEWQALQDLAPFDIDSADRISRIHLPNAATASFIAIEDEDRIRQALDEDDESILDLVAQFLQAYGPTETSILEEAWGLTPERAHAIADDLASAGRLYAGDLRGDSSSTICDTSNYEMLLRIHRSSSRRAVQAITPQRLQSVLAQHHRLGQHSDVLDALEQLLGYAAVAELWEEELLPARVKNFQRGMLDRAAETTHVAWIGAGPRSITFSPTDDIDLVTDREGASNDVTELFRDEGARYPFDALLKRSDGTSDELTAALWEAAWSGLVSNDSLETLRRGIQSKFQASGVTPAGGRRSNFAQWRSSRPMSGNWYLLPTPRPASDGIDEDQRQRDRVRILLERYGILFRELLERESPSLRWRSVARTLRFMEFSGEVTGGYFVQGVTGLQFASPLGLRLLTVDDPPTQPYWMNAVDPISLAGVPIAGLRAIYPARRKSTHLVFDHAGLALISTRNAGHLKSLRPHDEVDAQHFAFLEHLLTRDVRPKRSIKIQLIDGEAASESPLRPTLELIANISSEGPALRAHKRYT